MKKTGYDMLYLVACALNGITPENERLKQMNLQKLFQMCQFHSLTATVDVALESAGIKDRQFIEAEARAVKKVIMLDAERGKICGYMEQNGIWYMPLKGVILKELYPKIGMRQMADNDILYDENFQTQVKEYMVSIGYTAESVGKGNHDAYLKPPIYNFELHRGLFGEGHDKKLYSYYKGIKSRLVRNEGSKLAYHFTDEDFYVYITAHEYKHYIISGTGLRSLADCYVYLKAKGEQMDWEYISQQLEELGISDFEEKSRQLAQKIFASETLPTLSDEERKMLEYYLFSGTYGTVSNYVQNGIEKSGGSKLKYMLSRAFPPMEFYRRNYPFIYRTKILIPFFCIFRIVRAFTVRRKKNLSEMRAVREFEG